jgi:hypothetical protein
MQAGLSKNDTSVLSALFDPESSLSSDVQMNADYPSSTSTNLRLREQEHLALQHINKESPSPEEIQQSICSLTVIIESEPKYASAWNNRAQARRMLVSDEKLSQHSTLVADILEDLGRAILLATPIQASMMVTNVDAKVLASAHTHRGYLLLLASKSEERRKMLSNVPSLRDLSTQSLEEAASRELAIGGRYGNETARQLAVKTNPYAKLCGSIVREALTKEITDFYQPQM